MVKFGVSQIEGEDENEGEIYFIIGAIQEDNTVYDDQYLFIRATGGDAFQREEELQKCMTVALALTEYAKNHNLSKKDFVFS